MIFPRHILFVTAIYLSLSGFLKKRYSAVHIFAQIYTENPATFPTQIDKNTVQICGNFWATQYMKNRPAVCKFIRNLDPDQNPKK